MLKINTIISDFSYVILFPKDSTYTASINVLHQELATTNDYNVFNHFSLNQELLDTYRQLSSNKTFYIFTDGSMHRVEDIQLQIDDIFSAAISARDIGFSKNNPQAFRELAQVLEIDPETTLFIDDKEENIQAAQEAGFQTHRFENTKETVQFLKTL